MSEWQVAKNDEWIRKHEVCVNIYTKFYNKGNPELGVTGEVVSIVNCYEIRNLQAVSFPHVAFLIVFLIARFSIQSKLFIYKRYKKLQEI